MKSHRKSSSSFHPAWTGIAVLAWSIQHVSASDMGQLLDQARAGQLTAQLKLAERFERGNTCPANVNWAVHWYGLAAEQGAAQAQYRLSRFYLEGDGVTPNDQLALLWLERAAHQGYALAQNKLGVCYLRGRGVPQDMIEAYKWFLLAAGTNQNVFAMANQKALAGRLTREQIVQAHQRASLVLVNRSGRP